MTVYVKYCGGCNPRYNRTELLQRMESDLPTIKFTYNSQQVADAVVIICGCSNACANREEVVGAYGTFVVWQDEDVSALYKFLEQVNNVVDKK